MKFKKLPCPYLDNENNPLTWSESFVVDFYELFVFMVRVFFGFLVFFAVLQVSIGQFIPILVNDVCPVLLK